MVSAPFLFKWPKKYFYFTIIWYIMLVYSNNVEIYYKLYMSF